MADEIPSSQATRFFSESSVDTAPGHRLSILRSSYEVINWYKGLLSPLAVETDPRQKRQLKATVISIVDYFTKILEGNSEIISITGLGNSRSMVIEIAKLFSSILKNYLVQPNCDGNKLLQNTQFLHSMLALCFELHLFVREVTDISFEFILKTLDVSEFDLWKQINFFANLYQPIPALFLVHLKELDYKIMAETAWQGHSYLFRVVQRSFNNSNSRNTEEKSEMYRHGCTQFFKKLAAFVARRIQQVCEHIGFDRSIQEAVWKKSQYFLSEHTEYLKDKKIDMVLLCCLYDVCKSRCEIPIVTLLKQYKQATAIDKVHNGKSEIEAVNDFLKHVYYLIMRIRKSEGENDLVLRIKEFNGSLVTNLTSAPLTPRSPFLMTPRTRKMCNADDQTNRLPFSSINNKMRRQIEFDCYEKPNKKIN